jgi:hypothetical protein
MGLSDEGHSTDGYHFKELVLRWGTRHRVDSEVGAITECDYQVRATPQR